MFEAKARSGEKAEHTRQYVSILSRFATQSSSIRGGFETTSSRFSLKENTPFVKIKRIFVDNVQKVYILPKWNI
jgi:hypothetical protein